MRMKLLGAIAALALLASPAVITQAVAVDNSISALCRADHAGTGYQRPGGFCDAVKAYATSAKGGGDVCPAGFEPNPTPPPKCIPEV